MARHIGDLDVLWLLSQVVDSFEAKGKTGVGLPLGNLTSQLLVNIYMNEFDQHLKRELKVKFYIRYADDFVIFSGSKSELEKLNPKVTEFLRKELKLELHPDKVFIKTFGSGVDFLGWINFPHHRVLRTTTKQRMFKKLEYNSKPGAIASYQGMLSHGNAYGLSIKLSTGWGDGQNRRCSDTISL